MDEKSLKVGKAMLACAIDKGYFDGGEFMVIEELAEVEKNLFLEMFRRLEKHREYEKRNELTVDEISAMFSFVFARSVEAVVNYYNGNPQELDYMGLFDGKIPFYCDDKLTSFVKRSLFPRDMAEGFFDFVAENGENDEPALTLFEALKWTWRIGQHLALMQIA